jgi:hypothetical protein
MHTAEGGPTPDAGEAGPAVHASEAAATVHASTAEAASAMHATTAEAAPAVHTTTTAETAPAVTTAATAAATATSKSRRCESKRCGGHASNQKIKRPAVHPIPPLLKRSGQFRRPKEIRRPNSSDNFK